MLLLIALGAVYIFLASGQEINHFFPIMYIIIAINLALRLCNNFTHIIKSYVLSEMNFATITSSDFD